MKLVLAIVNKDDSSTVSKELTKEGYGVTKLSTTGGFLMSGNTTFLIGVEEEKVDDVIAIITKFSQKRQEIVPAPTDLGVGVYASCPVEVTVGGATIFVLDIDRFEKV